MNKEQKIKEKESIFQVIFKLVGGLCFLLGAIAGFWDYQVGTYFMLIGLYNYVISKEF